MVKEATIVEPEAKRAPGTAQRTSLRRLGRDTAIYSLGVVLARAVSFFMLPVYTRYLTTSDYGVLSLLDMTVEIASILFVAGVTAGMSLFYYQTTDEYERGTIIRTGYMVEVLLGFLAGAIIMAAAVPIWHYGLRDAGTPGLVRLSGISLALSTLLGAPRAVLQMQQKSHSVVGLSITRLVLQLGLNILFVVGLRLNVAGVLYSTIIANGVVGLILAVWLFRSTHGRFSWPVLVRLRKYGVPTQISSAGQFMLTFGDRFFLQASHGAASVGLYGLAYQFGFLLNQIGATPIINAWNPQRLQLMSAPRAVRDAKYSEGFFFVNLVLLTMATAIGVGVRPILQIMTTPAFHAAARIVPLVLAAYVVVSWTDVIRFAVTAAERPRYLAYGSWAAVAVIVPLYALLIPRFGGAGAAVATLLAFLMRFGLMYYWSQKVWPVTYEWGRILRLTAISVAAVTTAVLIPARGFITNAGIAAVIMLAYVGAVWLVVLRPDDRSVAWQAIRAPRQTLAAFKAAA
jgi:O-antigen/teichoic acid export membrane protein